MSNTIIITWVRNGMALGTKWYGTRAHGYEMTRNQIYQSHFSVNMYMYICILSVFLITVVYFIVKKTPIYMYV